MMNKLMQLNHGNGSCLVSINDTFFTNSLKSVKFATLKLRVIVTKYLRRKDTMSFSHYFATKTRPIYYSHFPENFVSIS